MEGAVVRGIGVEGFVRQRLFEGAPFGEVVLGSWREVAIDEALPDVVHGLCRGVQHVGSVEAVVAELVEDEFVGGEVGNGARRQNGGSSGDVLAGNPPTAEANSLSIARRRVALESWLSW